MNELFDSSVMLFVEPATNGKRVSKVTARPRDLSRTYSFAAQHFYIVGVMIATSTLSKPQFPPVLGQQDCEGDALRTKFKLLS